MHSNVSYAFSVSVQGYLLKIKICQWNIESQMQTFSMSNACRNIDAFKKCAKANGWLILVEFRRNKNILQKQCTNYRAAWVAWMNDAVNWISISKFRLWNIPEGDIPCCKRLYSIKRKHLSKGVACHSQLKWETKALANKDIYRYAKTTLSFRWLDIWKIKFYGIVCDNKEIGIMKYAKWDKFGL